METLIYIFIPLIFVGAAWVCHRFMPKPALPVEVSQVLTMPLSPYAKEYATLRDRIKHAATKSELSVLEFQSLDFLNDFGERVRDMFDDLVSEINLRNHVLIAENNNTIVKAR